MPSVACVSAFNSGVSFPPGEPDKRLTNASMLTKPILCLVCSYFLPGLPMPMTNFTLFLFCLGLLFGLFTRLWFCACLRLGAFRTRLGLFFLLLADHLELRSLGRGFFHFFLNRQLHLEEEKLRIVQDFKLIGQDQIPDVER